MLVLIWFPFVTAKKISPVRNVYLSSRGRSLIRSHLNWPNIHKDCNGRGRTHFKWQFTLMASHWKAAKQIRTTAVWPRSEKGADWKQQSKRTNEIVMEMKREYNQLERKCLLRSNLLAADFIISVWSDALCVGWMAINHWAITACLYSAECAEFSNADCDCIHIHKSRTSFNFGHVCHIPYNSQAQYFCDELTFWTWTKLTQTIGHDTTCVDRKWYKSHQCLLELLVMLAQMRANEQIACVGCEGCTVRRNDDTWIVCRSCINV